MPEMIDTIMATICPTCVVSSNGIELKEVATLTADNLPAVIIS
jgi:hypothetical protein